MNWDSICYVLKSFGIRKAERKSFTDAFSILLMEEDVLDDPGTLYICLEQNPDARFEKALVVSFGECEVKADNYIELESGSTASVLNALVQTEDFLDNLNGLLSNASSDQEIIDLATNYLGQPFFYFDESYRILAISKRAADDNDPEWKYMSTNRFLSPESIRIMQEAGDLDLLAKADKPVVYDADFFPYVSIVSNIHYQGRPFGRVNRLCLNGKTTPVMIEECMIVSRNLFRMLSLNRTLQAEGPADRMIRDLLNGIQLSETHIRERLKMVHDFSGGVFRVCLVDVRQGADEHVPSYYSELLDRIFEGLHAISLIYENFVVLLLQEDQNVGMEFLLQKLQTFLKKQALSAGVSDNFDRLNALHSHFRQAKAAISYAKPGEQILFETVMIDHLIRLIPDKEREVFLSYELQTLENAQGSCSFPVLKTLQVYLECACSLKRAAQKLFLHKNTMLYRINKIKELLGADLSDPYQQVRLLAALKIRALLGDDY